MTSGVYRDGKLHLVVRKRELANDAARLAREIDEVDAKIGRSEVRELLDECSLAATCGGRHKTRPLGSSRTRSCGWCGNIAYDLSGLTPTEEELFLETAFPNGLPSRLFRRSDGALMSTDCRRSRRPLRSRVPRPLLAAMGIVVSLAGLSWCHSQSINCPSDERALRVQAPIGANAEGVATSQAIYK